MWLTLIRRFIEINDMKGGRAESKTCQIRNKKMKKAHMDEMILYEKKKRKITENKLKINWK